MVLSLDLSVYASWFIHTFSLQHWKGHRTPVLYLDRINNWNKELDVNKIQIKINLRFCCRREDGNTWKETIIREYEGSLKDLLPVICYSRFLLDIRPSCRVNRRVWCPSHPWLENSYGPWCAQFHSSSLCSGWWLCIVYFQMWKLHITIIIISRTK